MATCPSAIVWVKVGVRPSFGSKVTTWSSVTTSFTFTCLCPSRVVACRVVSPRVRLSTRPVGITAAIPLLSIVQCMVVKVALAGSSTRGTRVLRSPLSPSFMVRVAVVVVRLATGLYW